MWNIIKTKWRRETPITTSKITWAAAAIIVAVLVIERSEKLIQSMNNLQIYTCLGIKFYSLINTEEWLNSLNVGSRNNNNDDYQH